MLEKKSMKICLVEDEKLVRTTIRDELKEHGYNVVDFGNPFEALEYIKEESPEIVISDVKMPKMDGIELLTEIKKHSPETEVIIITAFGSVANAVETIKLGAFNYLTKPFEFDELDSTIRKIV
ncbi:MAG: response regulator, partial [Bacteroidetes bacterium]